MEIKKGVLISIDESDLVNGCFENNEITEIGEGCFQDFKTLKSITCKKVKTVGNYSIRSNGALVSLALPVCTSVGNDSISYNGALVSLALPVCTSVGNDSIRYNGALVSLALPVCTSVGNYSISNNGALVSLRIKNHKLNVKGIDGSCFVVESEKTTKGIKIYTGYNLLSVTKSIIEKENCYVAEKDGYTAHGDTPKEAIKDCLFKAIAEKIRKEPILKTTIIDINYYHTVTGACCQGIKSWMEQHEVKEGLTAEKLLPILEKKQAYGVESFKKLINW